MNSLLRHTLILLLLVAGSRRAQAQAQPTDQRQERMNRIENAKIAYLTDKLSLSQDQAQRFWPLYNEYSKKRRDLGQRQRQLRTTPVETLSDPQVQDLIKENFALRQSELTLEKDYFGKFQKVLSVRQTGQLLVAEREFTREILQKLGGWRNGGQPATAGAAE